MAKKAKRDRVAEALKRFGLHQVALRVPIDRLLAFGDTKVMMQRYAISEQRLRKWHEATTTAQEK